MNREEQIREALASALEMLAWIDTAAYILIKQLKVVYVNDDEIAATDGRKLFIYNGFLRFDSKTRALILFHELLHVLLKHVERMEKKNAVIWNIATDTVINYKLNSQFSAQLPIHVEIVGTESAEELYERLKKEAENANNNESEGNSEKKDNNGKSGSSGNSGKSKNKGDLLDEERAKSEEERSKVVKDGKEVDSEEEKDRMIAQAVAIAKAAGTGKGSITALLEELLKPKINWKKIIKNEVVSIIQKNAITTWKKENRRNSELPASIKISKPKVFIAIDVSGSVFDRAKEFVSEIEGIAKESAEIEVIMWDDGISEIKRIKRAAEIREIKGGGGTRFAPVAEYLAKKTSKNDIVIVFSDGEWFDTDEAVKIIEKIKAMTVLATTGKTIKAFKKVVKIEGD